MADPDFDFDYYNAAQYLNAAASAAASDKGAPSDPIHLSLCDAVYIGQENNEPCGPECAPEQFAPGDVEEDEDDDEGDRYFCDPLDELLLPPANFHSSQFDLLPENTGFHTSIGEFDQKWESSYFIDPSVLAIQEPQLYASTQPTEPLIPTDMEQMATQVDMDELPMPHALPQALPGALPAALPAAIEQSLPEPLEQLEPLEAVPQLTSPRSSPEVPLLSAKTEPQTPVAVAPVTPSAPVAISSPLPAPALRTLSEDSGDDNATDTDYTPNSQHSSMQSFGSRKRVKTRRVVPSKLAKRDKYVCSMADLKGNPCGKTFGRPYDLERHLDIHNPNRRTHFCKYCPGQDKLFSRADALTRHIKNKHGRDE